MSKYRLYTIAVLCYWRLEWTELDDHEKYRLKVTQELQKIIKNCFETNTNIPNAANEVSIFTKMNAENF